MERDFLGLNLKESVSVVKEETVDGSKDQVFMGGPGIQWAFANKVSALPHFLSFKAAQEERPKKMIFDPITSSAFQPVSPANVFDSGHKAPGISQKTINLDRQGAHFAMQAYPFHSVDGSHCSQEIRTFPVSNHSFSVPMTNHFFKIHGALGGPIATTNPVKQQPLGGIPVANPHHIVPVMGSMAGTYASRNPSKLAAAPAQMTVFYAGTVNVYNDISPEMAQAIMQLAGNGSSVTANAAIPRAQVPASVPKHAVQDGTNGNQSQASSPCSGLSSPISVTSHAGAHSGGTSSNTDDLMAMKAVLPPRSQADPPQAITSIGAAAGTLMPAAVPQARKASLARFLEKRKERVTNAAPYPCKKSIEHAPGSDAAGLAFESQTASMALSSSKDQSR
ncbi:protein TIFY 6B-like protein [Cinnamomum micranthum f. kanehirae]|uniref:Protein TIFY n=1 Tax=Cinnamomum micranthum f. kanehirae TaxID=337451 RepID=A0A3S3MNH9_9MAGN|nr:protein TIFY 6B-like protein [Cinnamomum micranthum f. kanehirae]